MADRPFGLIAVVVCDSVGCGNAPDADAFGDKGANTIAHVVEQAGIQLPYLAALGPESIPGVPVLGGPARSDIPAACGRMFSTSPAKDTMVGHWELMGVVADQAFPTFPDGFPDEIIDELHVPLVGKQARPRTYRVKARRRFIAFTKKKRPGRQALRRAKKQQLGFLRRNLQAIDRLLENPKALPLSHLGRRMYKSLPDVQELVGLP